MDIYELAYGNDGFTSQDVDMRRFHLQGMGREEREELESERAQGCDMLSPEEELDRLTDFKAAVFGDSWADRLGFIAESQWDEYAADWARDVYGEATETAYWDAEKWSQALMQDYTAVE